MKFNCSLLKSNSVHSRNLFCLFFFLILLLVEESVSVNFSLQSMQKCEFNRLSDQTEELELPPNLSSSKLPLKFRLSEKCATRLPHCLRPCPSPMTQLPISLLPPPPLPKPQGNGTEHYHFDDIITHFTPRGYFRYANEYFSPDDFCLYSLQEEQLIVKICPFKCASGGATEPSDSPAPSHELEDGQVQDQSDPGADSFQVCVPKCCSIHKVLDLRNMTCEETHSAIPWSPLVYRSASRQICGEKRTNLKLHYVQTPPLCHNFNKYFLRPIPRTTRVRFRLLTNGTVLLRELGDSTWMVLEQGTYCLDGVQGYGSQPRDYMGDPLDQVLLLSLCDQTGELLDEEEEVSTMEASSSDNHSKVAKMGLKSSKEDRLNITGISYILLLISGVPFLLVTAIVYVLVWTKQNVHGWTQFSHTLAVLLHYLAQAVANAVSRIFNSDHNASSICRIVGISNHFFVLASFTWLTVINYDLFSMFRYSKFKSQHRLKTTVGRSRGLKRFLAYMALAWGLPFIAVTISVILDKLYGLYGDDGDCEVDVIVPLYGHRTCYMAEDARPYFLFYPVGILMMFNMVLAGMTFVNMYKHDQSAKMVTESSTNHRRKYKRLKFLICTRLFIVMGLVWIFEMFVWLFIKEGETLPWYLVFPDVFNFFQAVAIFILFACQPKILNQVEDSYPKLKGITNLLKKLSCNNNLAGKTQLKSTNLTSLPASRSQSANNIANNNATKVNGTDNGQIKMAVLDSEKSNGNRT